MNQENIPAFPKWTPDGDAPQKGMTLRDYFAAKAMQSLITLHSGVNNELQDIPESAYQFADAMLNQRIK